LLMFSKLLIAHTMPRKLADFSNRKTLKIIFFWIWTKFPPRSNQHYWIHERYARDKPYRPTASNLIISFHTAIILSSSLARALKGSAWQCCFMDTITQSLPHSLWLILLPIIWSQIFQVTWAFVLLSVQFSYDFQPSYFGTTSVNNHFHLMYRTM
jgi:hypothetical protein